MSACDRVSYGHRASGKREARKPWTLEGRSCPFSLASCFQRALLHVQDEQRLCPRFDALASDHYLTNVAAGW